MKAVPLSMALQIQIQQDQPYVIDKSHTRQQKLDFL
jgi:hypothetical protein